MALSGFASYGQDKPMGPSPKSFERYPSDEEER